MTLPKRNTPTQGAYMGMTHTDLELLNPRDRTIPAIKVKALADTGSFHLCISEDIATALKLETLYEQDVTLADGTKRRCPYVGPIQTRYDKDHQGFTGAFVLGTG